MTAVSALCAWAQSSNSLDLSSLDKLDKKAKEVNRVSLNQEQLKAALQMAGPVGDGMKPMLQGLEGVEVRNYEFENSGEYSDADLDGIRSQLSKMKGCSKIVDSKEKNERSEIYMCSENGKQSGIAVIDAEQKELSVVFVKGPVNMKDLSKLHGAMGLPNLQLSPGGKDNKKANDE